MTQDDMEQVKYKCSVCSRSHQIDDTSLARIIEDFKDLGWGNVADETQEKTVYTVYCPRCYDDIEDHAANMEELDDQEYYRQGV